MGCAALQARLGEPMKVPRGTDNLTPSAEQQSRSRLPAEGSRPRRAAVANKSPMLEPIAPFAVAGEDPEQDILPGLPRGFLAYQFNAKRYSVDGGGRGGAGRSNRLSGDVVPPLSSNREAGS